MPYLSSYQRARRAVGFEDLSSAARMRAGAGPGSRHTHTNTQGASGESERSMVKSEGLIRRVTTIAAGLLLAALLAVLVLLWGERPAEAAFPGANGKIAYEYDTSSEQEIYAMDA